MPSGWVPDEAAAFFRAAAPFRPRRRRHQPRRLCRPPLPAPLRRQVRPPPMPEFGFPHLARPTEDWVRVLMLMTRLCTRCRDQRRDPRARGGLRHLGRHHGAPGAAGAACATSTISVPASEGPRPPSMYRDSFYPPLLLCFAVTCKFLCNADIFSRLATQSSSSIAGESF